ncbi:dihydrofolate reductase family protein [uncultured Limosilactobacillus sp.]|uniref:dihydrofolate reductase family protein n=1 Tax=uncultured Limosilactobacillus sp. TaxID=2837629 RepID=UPI0025FBC58B|nr:dihydrofolate reductase family protein [uncultured Limosilactobacillus sp.]
MSKPYIIVHMMESIDGRIDCGMTAQLAGNTEYYATLAAIDAPTRVSGRVTAATELSDGSQFIPQNKAKIGHTAFTKNTTADQYNIVVDTQGRIRWGAENNFNFPHLIITSEEVTKEYLDDLNRQGISWIATGKGRIDLKRAMDILATKFGINRLAVVGGGRINGGFLRAGLVDEISILIGPGIDGRSDQPSLFDGLPMRDTPHALKLKNVKSYDDGAVWLRYLVQ